ncbi:hypothetical protein ACTJLD_19770 [Burkholderia sp. 22088]|uniref:hypothetical protein n=1 Tax=Burkholderia sp. 22088 TaxID=3453871 RepID=UPI003F8289AA
MTTDNASRGDKTITFRGESLTLSGAQLLEALDFLAPDRDRDQLESELTFRRGEGHAGNGMYCWLTEYPEEGALFVDGSTTVPTEAAPAPEDERAEGVDGLAHEVWSAAQLAPAGRRHRGRGAANRRHPLPLARYFPVCRSTSAPR